MTLYYISISIGAGLEGLRLYIKCMYITGPGTLDTPLNIMDN